MRAHEWKNADQGILLSDMGQCVPAAALARRRKKGRWKLISYETAEFLGTCISAGPLTDAAPLTLDLGLRGWHALYLGLAWYYGADNVARVRLSSQRAYRRRSHKARQTEIEEVLLTCADLTGEKLHIAQQSAGTPRACVVMYVRCVPMTDEEAHAYQCEGNNRATKRLVATVDGHSYLCDRKPTTLEEIEEELTDLGESDFSTIWYGGVDSGLASRTPPEMDDFPGVHYRNHYEATRLLDERGVDVNRVVVEAAHAAGLEVHMSFRPGSFAHPVPFEDYDAPIFVEHPEWRCQDRDGTPVGRLSFAAPEVRAHVSDLFRRALEAGPDGINILFNRGCSVILWEEAFCERFRERFGLDARDFDDDDPRIRQIRAEIMTDLMQELRELLNAAAETMGRDKPLKLSAMCLGTEELNGRFGLDVEGWVREGLIDAVGISWAAFDAYSHVNGTPFYDLDYYSRITAGTEVEVFPNLNPIEWESMGDPEARVANWHCSDLRIRSREHYAGGADGLVFWDVSNAREDGRLWPVISRLGHVEEIPTEPAPRAPERVTYPIRTWAGIFYEGRFNPWAGG